MVTRYFSGYPESVDDIGTYGLKTREHVETALNWSRQTQDTRLTAMWLHEAM